MDQAKEKLKILLIHRPQTEDGDVSWTRFAKALASFTNLELVESDSFLHGDLPEHPLASFQHIFLDYSLCDWAFLDSFSAAPLSLVTKNNFSLESEGNRELIGTKLKGRSCLNISDLSATDMARILHLYLIPKRVAGVIPLLEKNAVILGEKIQGPESIGSSLDRLATYLEQMESFELKLRIPDLRQVLSAVLLESYRLAKASNTFYPTIDFQVGISAKKLVINLRFQNNSLSLSNLASGALNGTDLFWQQAWLCSDLSLFTEHTAHQELEVMFMLFKPQRDSSAVFHSLLLKTLEKSGKRENLLSKPQDFTFQFLSDVRLKKVDVGSVQMDANEISSDIDLGTLPEPVQAKLKELTESLAFSQDQLASRENEVREIIARLSAVELEMQQKRGEVLRLGKINQAQSGTAAKRIRDLERRLQNLQAQQQAEQRAVKETKSDAGTAEILPKLEANIRVLEGEKLQLQEKFTSEQRRYAALEQKYNALYKELSAKDKDINELKSGMLKLRKENDKNENAAAAAKSATAVSSNDSAKVKELELRETALKQELKKMVFKVENNEKNVKAIQNESAEKMKLFEQKLQAAKAKELELLKKIDDLAALVKKASKAA
ncbi:MAG: hypothetical protein AB7K68_01195 [Bacteriovoracia bacterium]